MLVILSVGDMICGDGFKDFLCGLHGEVFPHFEPCHARPRGRDIDSTEWHGRRLKAFYLWFDGCGCAYPKTLCQFVNRYAKHTGKGDGLGQLQVLQFLARDEAADGSLLSAPCHRQIFLAVASALKPFPDPFMLCAVHGIVSLSCSCVLQARYRNVFWGYTQVNGRGTDEEKLLISVAEAARRLSVSESYMWELVAKGAVPSGKIGGRRLVPVKALEDWVEQKFAAEATASV